MPVRCRANKCVLFSVVPDKHIGDHPDGRSVTKYGWLSIAKVLAGKYLNHELSLERPA